MPPFGSQDWVDRNNTLGMGRSVGLRVAEEEVQDASRELIHRSLFPPEMEVNRNFEHVSHGLGPDAGRGASVKLLLQGHYKLPEFLIIPPSMKWVLPVT
jgi:hypothetical protein